MYVRQEKIIKAAACRTNSKAGMQKLRRAFAKNFQERFGISARNI
jgi:hypothetical protein